MADFVKDNAASLGTFGRAAGTLRQGAAAQEAAGFQAKGLRRAAVAQRAQGSQEAAETMRQARLLQSRARAVSAANGGGVAVDTIAALEGEGELRALTALQQGETAARGLEAQAGATEYAGAQARQTAGLRAGAGLVEQFPTLWEKYGGDWQDWMGRDAETA
jgi:hypothetical protein